VQAAQGRWDWINGMLKPSRRAVPCCAVLCCVQTADDMLCRALYALEGAWVHGFDPTTGNVRLDFESAPNRGLFLALFRHAQVMKGGRGGGDARGAGGGRD
jgi:hypothetical protein